MLKYLQDHGETMADQVALLDEAAILNPQLVSLPRIQILQVLEVYGPDGMEFRELQAQMGMSDGKLLSNLYALRGLGVIDEEKAKVETKSLTTYRLNATGQEEWKRTRTWLLNWLGSA